MGRRAFHHVLISLIFTIIASTASAMPNRWQYFEELDDQTLPSPTEETAIVVFVLPTDGGDLAGAVITGALLLPMAFVKTVTQIYDATSEDLKFLSQIRRGTKTAIEIPSGNYIFMAANLLSVNLEAGKTYYIFLNAVGGLFAAQYPVRNGGSGQLQFASGKFQSDFEATTLFKVHPVSVEYYSKKNWVYKTRVKARKQLLEKWNEKSEQERLEFTLNPEDGIPVGYSLPDALPDQSKEVEPSINQPILSHEKDVSSIEEPQLPDEEVSPACSERLKALDGLRADGIFSESEYQKQIKEVLEGEDC